MQQTASKVQKSGQLTGNFTEMVKPPGNQSTQRQAEEDGHHNVERMDWRHQQTNGISVQQRWTSRPVRSQLQTALNYRYLRKRMGCSWEKPGKAQWATGPVSDTSCWTRGYTSSPPPLLLYTCKFILKNKTEALSRQHPDGSDVILQDTRCSLGTALADLAGLIWDTERPQSALASGV